MPKKERRIKRRIRIRIRIRIIIIRNGAKTISLLLFGRLNKSLMKKELKIIR